MDTTTTGICSPSTLPVAGEYASPSPFTSHPSFLSCWCCHVFLSLQLWMNAPHRRSYQEASHGQPPDAATRRWPSLPIPTLPWAAAWALSLPMVRSLIPCLTSEWCDAGRCLVVCGNKTYVTVMLFDLVWRRFTTCSSRIAL
jgi:ABC-type Fe3+ transport system permease subunit